MDEELDVKPYVSSEEESDLDEEEQRERDILEAEGYSTDDGQFEDAEEAVECPDFPECPHQHIGDTQWAFPGCKLDETFLIESEGDEDFVDNDIKFLLEEYDLTKSPRHGFKHEWQQAEVKTEEPRSSSAASSAVADNLEALVERFE